MIRVTLLNGEFLSHHAMADAGINPIDINDLLGTFLMARHPEIIGEFALKVVRDSDQIAKFEPIPTCLFIRTLDIELHNHGGAKQAQRGFHPRKTR